VRDDRTLGHEVRPTLVVRANEVTE